MKINFVEMIAVMISVTTVSLSVAYCGHNIVDEPTKKEVKK
jgi:hypothetical protein